MYFDTSPLLIGFHVLPASSVLNAPAAEMAMYIRSALLGSRITVCKHNPPAPGCQRGPEPCSRNPFSSSHVAPPSDDLKRAASSIRSEERRVGKECRSRWSP